MPSRRENVVRPLPSTLVTRAVALAMFALVVAMIDLPSHSAAATVPPGAMSARAAAASTAPHPVAPVISNAPIPQVRTNRAAAGVDGLSNISGTSARGPLAAHVVRTGTHDFQLVGVTWSSTSTADGIMVYARTRTAGAWSGWARLGYDPTDAPSAKTERSARPGTDPLWVPGATGVEVAVFTTNGRAPHDLQVATIDPGSSAADAQVVEASRRANGVSAAVLAKGSASANVATPGFPGMPSIITRAQWGADPRLGDACWAPKYGTALKAVIIHHTVTSNTYTAAQSPAIVRSIYAYHTQTQGWCDIAYNFLVDKYGNIFEGRRGGMRRPVRGAHSGNYNVNTTGISMMGNFDLVQPSTAMKTALIKLVGWRVGTAYESGYGRTFIYDRTITRISGHRDVMSTACPGTYGYAYLPTLRAAVTTYVSRMNTAIERAWRARGAQKSSLGLVRVGEQENGTGHMTVFQTARMYSSKDTGVRTLVNGPVLTRFLHGREILHDLGYPRTNVLRFNNGTVQLARFVKGNIYYSHSTGAHVLTGPMLAKYWSLGSFEGRLGLPTSEMVATSTGSLVRFHGGSMTYNKATGAITVTYS